MVRLGDVCEINPKKNEVANLAPSTLVSFVPMADLGEHQMLFSPKDEKPLSDVGASYTYFRDNDVLVAKVTPCFENGKAGIARELRNGIGFGSSEFYVLRPSEQILSEYVYFCVTNSLFREAAVSQMTDTGGLQRVPRGYVEEFQIPLPPLEIQREIVAEIEAYQKVINGARAVLDNYRPHIPINPDWPMVELGDISDSFQYGSSLKSSDSGEVVCLRMGNIQNGEIDWSDLKFAPENEDLDKYLLSPNDVLFNRTNSPIHVGKTGIYRGGRPAVFAGYLIRINYQKDKILGPYLNCCLNTKEAKDFCSRVKTDGINQSNINAKVLQTFSIPLPPIAEQQDIIAEIEAEQALVNANRELITRFEAKIQTTLSRIWGDPN